MSEGLVKICALALICVCVGMLLRQLRGDVAFALRIAGSVMAFGILLMSLNAFLENINELWLGDGGKYAQIMTKGLGIALLTHITAGICRDCGESGAASWVELAGKLEILFLCAPLISEILGYASEIISLEG